MQINIGQLFITTFMTMVMIAIIKYLGTTYQIPVLKEVSEIV